LIRLIDCENSYSGRLTQMTSPSDPNIQLPYLWSIGIYAGQSASSLMPSPKVRNPILTSAKVTDIPAAFVADPFMLRSSGTWHMFFEVFNNETYQGEIGLASSTNGCDWEYRNIVLAEPFHLSYPYVFEWEDEYYMVPETLERRCIQLYKADPFPNKWVPVDSLVEGEFADPSIFRFHDRWWMFACSTPHEHDTLRLFMARRLEGPWGEHPSSPIVQGNNRSARPAGRVLVLGDTIIRYAQDCFPIYGSQVRAFEISRLTPDAYVERESKHSPVLIGTGSGWNAVGMHHIDPHLTGDNGWLACVDGQCANVESGNATQPPGHLVKPA
jgi:hypothetical protein